MTRLTKLKVPALLTVLALLTVAHVGFAHTGTEVRPNRTAITTSLSLGAVAPPPVSPVLIPPVTALPSPVPVATLPPVPVDTGSALGLVPSILHAFSTGDYSLGFALLLLIVVYVVRNFFWKSIPDAMVPIATAGLAALTAVAGALYVHVDPVKAIESGLGIGLATVGFWECVGQHVEDFILFKMGKLPAPTSPKA